MSQTPNPNQTSNQIETPLDKIIFSLTEKKKKLDQETETLFNKVKVYVDNQVNKLKESGYRVTYHDCEKKGILYINCVIFLEVDKFVFDALKSTEMEGKFEDYKAKLRIEKRFGKNPEVDLTFDVEGNSNLLDSDNNENNDEDFVEEDYEEEDE